MRQAQHNKRSRGRGRKSSSPGNRVYESNGPDVKVRGNASHIAEKYVNLARDASSFGDLVAAENYFQHAEHYFRLVAAAQSQIRPEARPELHPEQAQNRPRHGGDQQSGRVPAEGADSIESGDAGQDKSADDAGPDGAAGQAEADRSPGRNRRPAADRRTAKPRNGDDSRSDASSVQVTNGADVEEPAEAEIEAEAEAEIEQVTETKSRSGDEGAASEDAAEAEAEL